MRQQPTFHRLGGRPATAAAGGRERPEGGGAPSMMVPLPPGWLCLQDCNLSGQLNRPVVVPFVLMHPDVGVALIDVAPSSNPEAEGVLRRRLDLARFESIFPGYLPVLHLRLDRADLPSTEAILRDAFAALPPLSVPGGDGWVSVVRRALLPRDPSRAAAHHAGLPPAGPPPAAAARAQWQHGARRAEDGLARTTTDTEADMLHREVAARAAAAAPLPDAPEPAARPTSALPWIIMSGVGGLIAVLALFGLLNTGADKAANTADEARGAAAPVVAAAPAPPAAPAPLLVPAPAPGPVASSPKPPPASPSPAAGPSPAQPPASAPVATAAPPSNAPSSAASTAGASATPTPAQRPAATAADRLPRVTVRQPANLRTGPNDQANIVRVAPRGEAFRVHGRSANGWLQVGDSEPRGWLHTSRLGEVAE